MPKKLFIDPQVTRKPDFITFDKIPVNQYQKTIQDEKSQLTTDDLIRIYRDMRIIREFELMLNEFKTTNTYNGLSYHHPGPAHLSIGQEAAAVGMAFHLGINDYIFGSHRSHGEILAKGLSAIHALDEKSLQSIMESYMDGDAYNVVLRDQKGNVSDLAIDFLLYGTLAEIFAKRTGFNKGLGGSMHVFFPPFGIYPNNAIVGGSGDIAVGAALYKKVNQEPGIIVANIGDASMGCGPVWEGMVFAAMDQFKSLWEEPYRGGLPVLFNVMNNQYGMGGQTRGETMGYDMLARVGAGVNPEMMHAERIDGFNPLAVIDAFRRKKKILENGQGPVLLDTLTYRFSGHSPSDASSYRSKEELEAWMAHDPLDHYREQLVEAAVVKETDLEAVEQHVKDTIIRITEWAIDDARSPRMDLRKSGDIIGGMMFSNGSLDRMDDRTPEVLLPKERNPRVELIRKKNRFAFDEDGKPFSKVKVYQLRDALFEAILDRFYKDPTLIAYGEENREWGGAFAVYRGLTEALPYHRLFNTSISEGAIVGTAIGYGMCGGRVLPEIMYCDFLGRAGDEVFNQLPKWQAMSGNTLKMPVVVRVSVGSKYGAQHSQDWTSLVAHIPGLKVVFPATPYDAKGLMNAALQGTDPVVFFESQRIYDVGEMFHKGGVPEDYYEIPIGQPDIKREGTDLTILSIGATLYKAIEAAQVLHDRYQLEAEVVDARSLVPFDYDLILKSVRKTGRILLVSDASSRGSYLKDMASTITELAFDDLDGPPVVVGARNWIVPAYELENDYFPQTSWILDAIHEKLLPLENHTPSIEQTDEYLLNISRLGI